MKKSIFILFCLAFAPSALGQASFVNLGSKPGTDSGIVSYSDGSTFQVRVQPDRSVYCRYRGGISNDVTFSTTLGCLNGTCPTARHVGDADSGIDSIVGVNDALAFIADNNDGGAAASNNRYDITFTEVSPSPANLIVECFNTTLYGNFNTVTVANPFNFLELSNDSAIDLNTRIVVIKNDGTELARVNVTVPAGQQKDISVHDIAGAANTFGRIMVAHDGALDGLRAKITKYTSSFVITASDKFETRPNQQ